MKVRKGFVVAGIFFALTVFCLLFASCPDGRKDPIMEVTVKTNADSGRGSLRDIIDTAPDGGTINIAPDVGTIALTAPLQIHASITIRGNGVTLTRAASWTTEDNQSQLMRIEYNKKVTASRIHFKDGKASNYSGAVHNNGGYLTLESCIFSGNRGGADGGAVYSFGNMNIKGCTFYGNSARNGGAVYYYGNNKDSTLTLTGNLFYGNTASDRGPVVYRGNGSPVTSDYNAVDVAVAAFVTGYTLGDKWTAGEGDKTFTVQPLLPSNFKLISTSEAAGIIDRLPADYPAKDFYGNPITAPASAGAVQGVESESGYVLKTAVNNSVRGSVNVTPPPSVDGLYSGTVTFTAEPDGGYDFSYWLVDGENAGEANPLVLTITDHTNVQAVFAVIIVNDFSDGPDSRITRGRLRYAMTNVQNGDTIRLVGVTPGETVIELDDRLDLSSSSGNNTNITIEGNGVTLTPSAFWKLDIDSPLLIQNGRTTISTIRRIHFKDGRVTTNGLAPSTNGGGAIRIYSGNMTLESCIFSGNRTTNSYGNGGAIFVDGNGTLDVRGCTFYGNSTERLGGAIYRQGKLNLTGNLFYENTSQYGLTVFGTTEDLPAYNAVDVYGSGSYPDWEAGTGNKTFTELGITGVPFNTVTFAPVPGLGSFIPTRPEGFPATDFHGETRTFPGTAGAVR
jgi:hypothetical protein